MPRGYRISNAIRDVSPCKDCTERFSACQDRCPKDARGEYGYKAWRAEMDRVKEERSKYIDRCNVRQKAYYGRNSYGKE